MSVRVVKFEAVDVQVTNVEDGDDIDFRPWTNDAAAVGDCSVFSQLWLPPSEAVRLQAMRAGLASVGSAGNSGACDGSSDAAMARDDNTVAAAQLASYNTLQYTAAPSNHPPH